jgi:hypothetical protein
MTELWWEPLQVEWDSIVCPVCKEAKWARYPFCRSCSIKLQRIGLMEELRNWCGTASQHLPKEYWARRYDRARDYLFVSRRYGQTGGPTREEGLRGPFPPTLSPPGQDCVACGQSFPHATPAGMKPKNVVDLLRYPDFDFSEYPDTYAACKHCWRPLNGAPDCLIRA